MSSDRISIYLHWPFCESKCPYCDFNSHVRKNIIQKDWLLGYLSNIKLWLSRFPTQKIKTLYFGGGTPSLMDPNIVSDIIEHLYKNYSTSENMVNCANCIQAIRKIPQCYINSVYREEPNFQALYYSRHYLQSIDKNCRDMYDEKRRQRSYSETELMLIQSIEGKNHQPRKHAKTLTSEIRKHDNVRRKCTKVENDLTSKISETDDLLEMYSPSPPRTFGEFLNLLENTDPSTDTSTSIDGI